MKHKHNWRRVQRFSIRKLSIGVVSATIGMTTLGISTPTTVSADEHSHQSSTEQIETTYTYLKYEDLTEEERASLVLTDKDFPKEIAEEGTDYILIYRRENGSTLPSTGELSTPLIGLLGSLGIIGVWLTRKKGSKQAAFRLLILTGVGVTLTSQDTQALETAFRQFLTETHLVASGNQLPQPQATIGDYAFRYYLKEKNSKAISAENPLEKIKSTPLNTSAALEDNPNKQENPTKSIEPQIISSWIDELYPKPVEPETVETWAEENYPTPAEPETVATWADDNFPTPTEPETVATWADDNFPTPTEPETVATWADENYPTPTEPETVETWTDENYPTPAEPETVEAWTEENYPTPVEPETDETWTDKNYPTTAEPETVETWTDENYPTPVEPETLETWTEENYPTPVEPETVETWAEENYPTPAEPETVEIWADEIYPTTAEPETVETWAEENYPTTAEPETVEAWTDEIYPTTAEPETVETWTDENFPTPAEPETVETWTDENYPSPAEPETVETWAEENYPTTTEPETVETWTDENYQTPVEPETVETWTDENYPTPAEPETVETWTEENYPTPVEPETVETWTDENYPTPAEPETVETWTDENYPTQAEPETVETWTDENFPTPTEPETVETWTDENYPTPAEPETVETWAEENYPTTTEPETVETWTDENFSTPVEPETVETWTDENYPTPVEPETVETWAEENYPTPAEPETVETWTDENYPTPVEPETVETWTDENYPAPVEPETVETWTDENYPTPAEPETVETWADENYPAPVEPETVETWTDENYPTPAEPETMETWTDENYPTPVEPETVETWAEENYTTPVEPETVETWTDENYPTPVEPETVETWTEENYPTTAEPETVETWADEIYPTPVEPETVETWTDENYPTPVEPETVETWADENFPTPVEPETVETWADDLYTELTKEKPTLEVLSTRQDDDNNSIAVSYKLTDNDDTYVSAISELYSGSQLITSVTLSKNSNLADLTGLSPYIPYTLKTSLTYNSNQGNQTELVDERTITLTPKKVEFRDVTAAELYKVGTDGQLERINGLTEAPAQLTDYIVKLVRDDHKDVYLPVSTISASSTDKLKVTASHPELVQFTNTNTTDGYSFEIDKVILKEGAYTKFDELIAAMKAKPNGEFFLASDMIVTPSTNTDTSYLSNFSGKLSSSDTTKRFTITGLDKPLFGTLTNATISNIAFADVAINQSTQKDVAALAKTITGTTTISDILVSGSITGKSNVAGLVATAADTSKIENITVDLKLAASERASSYNMGGVVATSNGSVKNVRSNVTIDQVLIAGSNIGGVVGQNGGSLTNAYATGSIKTTKAGANIGGIAGSGSYNWSTFKGSTANNIISGVQVTNGNSVVGATRGGTFTNVATTPTATGNATGTPVSQISADEANNRSATWGAKTLSSSSTPETSSTASSPLKNFDYSAVTGYQANRQKVYENMEKLLPYYDRYTIVKYGNKVDPSSSLYTKTLLSVVPMKGTDFVTDTVGTIDISRILLHFSDNTKEEHNVQGTGLYKTTGITEFTFGDLLYTPEQFSTVENTTVSELTNLLNSVPELTRESLITLLDIKDEYKTGGISINLTKEEIADRLLYLNKPLKAIQTNIEEHVKSLISSYASIDLSSDSLSRYLTSQIKQDKEKLLLALAYTHQAYDVHYGDIPLLDLVTYRPDFDGQKVDTLEYLLSLSDNANSLKLYENTATYEKKIAPNTPTASNLVDYLEQRRQLFLPDKTTEQWFKENTKAFIYEQPSKQKIDADVNLYHKLRDYTLDGKATYRKYILPLLNLDNDNQLYVLSSMTTLAFGNFGQSVDPSLSQTNPALYQQKIDEVKNTIIPLRMKELGDFLDLWYRISDTSSRDKLLERQTLIHQGFNVLSPTNTDSANKRWLEAINDSYSVVDDFFGPMGDYYTYAKQSAFANGSDTIKFLGADLLSTAGSSTLTHELTHNYDRAVIFNGNERRIGQSSESYALGLLQSIAGLDDYYYGFNFNMTFTGSANHNSSPIRFQTGQDLQNYMKGVMDVTYSLDLLELDSIAKLSKDKQLLFFNQLALAKQATEVTNGITYQHANDVIKQLTTSEWSKITTLTVEQLIDHDIIMKDATGTNGIKTYVRDDRDNYYLISLTAPIYGGLSNDTGTVGGLQFRRVAYEILAAKGWETGFIPYVSDQYRSQAEQENKPLSDQYIFNKILGETTTYKDFKKSEYAARASQLNNLRAVTITIDGQTQIISSTEDLKALFDAATAKDLTELQKGRNGFARHKLKLAVLKAYHQLTSDFTTSIYKN